MAKLFEVSEILEFAIRIEENGEVFYREMAKKIKKKEIKALFNWLADEEVRHRKIFEEMVSGVGKYEPAESYPGEYFAYLRAYVDEHIFTKEKKGKLMAGKIGSTKEAVKFAIGVELDSILYYLEAKNLVPESQRETIEKIVEEERRHYLKLKELKP
ncbi:MAG: ferritin family protein [Candidatus Omnitrophica bacterium]|nr:ferritin family protein [Candidatus Omnitrophota bacterium]